MILKFMRQRPSLTDFPGQLLHASYGADSLRIQLWFSHLDSRHISPLDDVKEQLSLWAADMNFKNLKRSGRFSTSMSYLEAVALLNKLENIQK